jgi:hypothetical protein
MSVVAQRAVFVTRESDYESLLARHGTRDQARFYLETRGQDIDEVERRHEHFTAALHQARAAVPGDWRQGLVKRAFRAETRAWLEANCPPEMREPMRSEKDACWGGRNFVFQSPAQKQWLDVMARAAGPCPTGRRNMAAAGCRRPRPRSSRRKWRDRRARR